MPVKTSNGKLDNDSFRVLFYLGLENIRGRETMRFKKKMLFSQFVPSTQIDILDLEYFEQLHAI